MIAKTRPRSRRKGAAGHEAPRPLFPLEPVVEEVDAAREREHHSDRRIRDLFRAIVGNVGDRDAALARVPEIDVVEADSAADDQLAVPEARDRVFRDDDVVIEHDSIGIFDFADKIGFGARVEHVQVGDVAEHFALGPKFVGDEIRHNNTEAGHNTSLGNC